ncbi:MAG: M24 family metallopeptidase, partial [Planctomycetes bacterium]|nr:M24 family metallopeptidase [Planctomycetota bacterium]
YELDSLREASRLAALGHQAAASAFRQGRSELEVHQAYLAASQQTDAELPYSSIVALNENGAILHYQHLQRNAPSNVRGPFQPIASRTQSLRICEHLPFLAERSDRFCVKPEKNRAAHFAGGRLRSRVHELGDQYSISLWFWNGMPNDARDVSGWMFSRGRDQGLGPHGDHVGVGGTASHPGKLVFLHGNGKGKSKPVFGRTEIRRWTWNHVVFVRDGEAVKVYLNGKPEIETASPADFPIAMDDLFFGGRCDNHSNWEGRLDEIAVFPRALSAKEVAGIVVK